MAEGFLRIGAMFFLMYFYLSSSIEKALFYELDISIANKYECKKVKNQCILNIC